MLLIIILLNFGERNTQLITHLVGGGRSEQYRQTINFKFSFVLQLLISTSFNDNQQCVFHMIQNKQIFVFIFWQLVCKFDSLTSAFICSVTFVLIMSEFLLWFKIFYVLTVLKYNFLLLKINYITDVAVSCSITIFIIVVVMTALLSYLNNIYCVTNL